MTVSRPPGGTTGPRPARLAAAMGASIAVHVLLLLAVAFDVAGAGGGFGLGVGPGFGIGAGGGVGLGDVPRRQIFSLEDLPELVRPDDDDEQIERLLRPEQRQAIEIPRPPRPVATKGPVVRFKRPVRPEGAGADLRQRFASAGAGAGGLGFGGGGGGFGVSLGSAFGKYVTNLRRVGLDVAIVIDATGSMQMVIDELKRRLESLVGTMQRLVPTARIGAVAFRDRTDDKVATAPRKSEDFVVRWTDLTFSSKKVQGFLAGIVAEGGGDWEEAVRQGLETAIGQLKWRPDSKKVIILVGSSPPHTADVPAIRALIASWRAAGGVVSTIDVSERLHEEHEKKLYRWLYGEDLPPGQMTALPDFYRQLQESYGTIAREGGGSSVRIDQDDVLMRQLLVLAFGSQWEKEVARIGRAM